MSYHTLLFVNHYGPNESLCL